MDGKFFKIHGSELRASAVKQCYLQGQDSGDRFRKAIDEKISALLIIHKNRISKIVKREKSQKTSLTILTNLFNCVKINLTN